MDLFEIVAEALSPLKVPIKYIVRPDMSRENIGISYHFYSETPSLYGDGEIQQVEGMLQVDIFYKAALGDLPRRIITLLKAQGFRWYDSSEDKETLAGVRLYHKILQFSYLQSEVEK